jgi:hypothetical protein
MTKILLAVVALATASLLTFAGPGATAPTADCPAADESSLAAAACSNVPVVATLDPAYSEAFVLPPAGRSAGRLGVASGASAGGEPGCRPLHAVFYAATDWFRLAQKLRGNSSPCAEYYVSVPPLAADKTKPRPNEAQRIRALGPQMHAMADIQYTAWGAWVDANDATWFDAGVEARRRMHASGYDVTQGDMWALNELPSSVRRGDGDARADARDFVRGLYTGDGATPPTAGLVWITGIGQSTADLSVYKRNLRSWLRDDAFWADMSLYVRLWSQEAYPDARRWGVPGADLATRRDALNDYLQHIAVLSEAGPEELAGTLGFLRAAYAPLAGAAWSYTSGFGYTAVSATQMQHFVSAQTYAMRNASARSPWRTGDAFGFAWAPDNPGLPAADFTRQTGEILDRLAAAIHESDAPAGEGGPDGAGLGACGEAQAWCDTDVEGGTFNPAWKILFGVWNYAPVAEGSAVTVDEDGAVGLGLVATDVDRDPLTRTVVDPPAHGTLTGTPLALTYTPAADFNGADSFTFRATDGEALSNLATVAITVRPVNDAPIVEIAGPGAVDEGATAALTAIGHDVDGDLLAYAWDATTGAIEARGETASFTADDGPATAAVSVLVDDGHGGSAHASRVLEVRNVAPSAGAGPDRSGAWGLPVALSGTATDASAADARAGLALSWSFGDGSPSAPAADAAHVYGEPGTYLATFTATDKDGATAADTATVSVGPRPSRLAYEGATALRGSAAGVSALLVDTADAPSARLGGHVVRFALGPATCSATTDASGRAGCTIDADARPLGPAVLTVELMGDALYEAAATTAKVVLYALPHGGAFVIGDRSATDEVTFWSPSWRVANRLSGGPAPASFKGFASSPAGTACGASWTALPGDESAPPTAPAYMAVVVASTVTKAGSTIAGNTAHLVVVRTDRYRAWLNGYGTVVATLC